MSQELIWLLVLSPIFVGVMLIASRPFLLWNDRGDLRVVLRIASIAVSLATAATLGFAVFYGLEAARRYLPDRGADAPLQLVGTIGLLYALASAVVMAAVLTMAARDALCILRRHGQPGRSH